MVKGHLVTLLLALAALWVILFAGISAIMSAALAAVRFSCWLAGGCA